MFSEPPCGNVRPHFLSWKLLCFRNTGSGCVIPSREAPWVSLFLTQLGVQTGLENPASLYVLRLGSLNCDSHYLCGLLSAVLSPTHLLYGFFYTKSKNCCLLVFLSRPPPLNPNSVFPPHDYSKKNTYNSQQNHFGHVAFKFVQQNVFIFPFPLLGNPTPKQQH